MSDAHYVIPQHLVEELDRRSAMINDLHGKLRAQQADSRSLYVFMFIGIVNWIAFACSLRWTPKTGQRGSLNANPQINDPHVQEEEKTA